MSESNELSIVKAGDNRVSILEKKIKKMSLSNEMCDWNTNNGGRCRKNCVDYVGENKYCGVHTKLITDYEKEREENRCETYKNTKIIPRSKKQLEYIMGKNNNEDTIVEVIFPGGAVEEADISDPDYIFLLSDNTRFYYNGPKGERKSKELKIISRDHCKNESCVIFNDTRYCEECYRKIKNAPKLKLVN